VLDAEGRTLEIALATANPFASISPRGDPGSPGIFPTGAAFATSNSNRVPNRPDRQSPGAGLAAFDAQKSRYDTEDVEWRIIDRFHLHGLAAKSYSPSRLMARPAARPRRNPPRRIPLPGVRSPLIVLLDERAVAIGPGAASVKLDGTSLRGSRTL